MNCASARNRLLALADPADVPDQVAGHLATCTACSAWHSLLVQVDAVIVATTVPAAAGGLKNQVLEQFRPIITMPKLDPNLAKPAAKVGGSVVVPAAKAPVGDRLARLWPAGAVAAAVLVGALAWTILGDRSNDEPVVADARDPMLERCVQLSVEAQKADTASNRLEAYDRLAATIHDQATSLAMVTPGKEMESLASRYDNVVMISLVGAARNLSEDERKLLLPKFKDRLSQAENDANRSASTAPPDSVQPLRDIARAAGEGRTQLARMMQGGQL